MSTQPKAPERATNPGASSVLPGGHPQGASGNGHGTDLSFTVSIPQIGAYRTQDHRYYWNGKGPLPSVTSILSVLDKPAIVQWAKRTVAEFAVSSLHNGELSQKLFETDDAETVKWLASLPDYQKDLAAKLGSGVHLLADMAARTTELDAEAFQVSDLEKPYLTAFQGFLSRLRSLRAEIVSSEKMVWSSDGYAGTYDLLIRFWNHRHEEPDQSCDAECSSELWLIDIKTARRGDYPETALQLVAYGYADQIIVEGNPNGFPMPKIDRYGVLHLRPELYPDTGYRLIQYPIQDSDYVAFLGALELYRWKQEGRYTRTVLKSGTSNPL